MALLANNIGYILTGLFVLTAMSCIAVNTIDSFAEAALLALLTLTGWVPSLWENPEAMATAHLCILLGMLLSLYNPESRSIILLTLAMIIADVVWVIVPDIFVSDNFLHFPGSLFWWQSVLNIIYLLICVRILIACYHSRAKAGDRSNGRGSFYARVAGIPKGSKPH